MCHCEETFTVWLSLTAAGSYNSDILNAQQSADRANLVFLSDQSKYIARILSAELIHHVDTKRLEMNVVSLFFSSCLDGSKITDFAMQSTRAAAKTVVCPQRSSRASRQNSTRNSLNKIMINMKKIKLCDHLFLSLWDLRAFEALKNAE